MTNYRKPKPSLHPVGELSKLLTAISLTTFIYIPNSVKAETFINNRTCPADFPSLSAALAKDLPDYLNRVYTRLRINRVVMTISQPELEPLPLAPGQPRDRLPQQVFLSILERQTGKTETSQRAYWLFVVPTSNGWRLSMAFMRIGQAPPVDVSDAAISDAANRWLRDYCDPRYQRHSSFQMSAYSFENRKSIPK